MKKILCILVGVLLFSGMVWAGELQFFREDLTFEITEDNNFRVDGIYYFRNNSDHRIKRVLFYPFPQDSLYGAIDQVSAVCLDADSTEVIIKTNETGTFFTVDVGGGLTTRCRISYRQKLLDFQAEYILVSTRNWGEPFELVHYQLLVPEELKIHSFSYPPDSSGTLNNKQVYFWQKQNFLPDRNMIIKYNDGIKGR